MSRKQEKNFGVALRKARKDANVHLYELAETLGVSVPFLSDVENGRRPLSNDRICTAAKHLGVDPFPLLELATKDRGRIVLDTSSLNKKQLRAATLLSMSWPNVPGTTVEHLLSNLKESA